MTNPIKAKAYHERHIAGETWQQIADTEHLLPHSVRNTVRRWRKRNLGAIPAAPAGPQFGTKLPTPPDFEELIALARATQVAVDAVDPILVTETITVPGNVPIGIVFVSCMHLGSRYVQHKAFADFLEQVIAIPNLYWIDLGDQVEGMQGFFDVASAHEQALADPKLQRLLLAHVLDKLASAGRLLCGFAGQHGADWARRKSAEDPIKRLYLERNIRYFDGQVYLNLTVGDQRYKIFAAHQLPGRSMYNKVHAQRRAALFKAPNADIVVQGDAHQYAVQQVALDTFEYLAGERPSVYQWYIQSSTAKVGNDPYTIKTWSPAFWDWPTMIFRHDRHQVAQAADLRVAELMLSQW